MNQYRLGEISCNSKITIKDLCMAGKTANLHPEITNEPKSEDSIDALNGLIERILEPLRLHFGGLVITHGFTNAELIRKVQSGVAQKLDQHCAHELNQNGKRICERDGAAADIYVPKISSKILTKFIIEHCSFDRIYIYGDTCPVHVSYCHESGQARQIVLLKESLTGRRIPQVLNATKTTDYLYSAD